MKLDIMAIGVHPDDVELGCGGTLALHASKGASVGIVDLTTGQLGTRGTPEIRVQEAEEAAKILGASIRENLGMEDGYFVNDAKHQLQLIQSIRKYRPDVVLANAPDDRHPDHGRAAQLIKEACFYAGLRKIESQWEGEVQEAWRPKRLYHYIQFRYLTPDLIVDISDHAETKMKAIKAFASQFYDPSSNAPETLISSQRFMHQIESRMTEFGGQIHVNYGEGFITERVPGVSGLLDLK